MKNIQNIKYKKVTFNIPDDWEDDTVLVWTAPVEDGEVAPSVVITQSGLPDDQSFEEFITAEQHKLTAETSEYVLHEKSELNDKAYPCIKNKQSWRLGGPRITQIQYTYLIDSSQLHTITCTYLTEKFDQVEKMFEEISQTFQIAK